MLAWVLDSSLRSWIIFSLLSEYLFCKEGEEEEKVREEGGKRQRRTCQGHCHYSNLRWWVLSRFRPPTGCPHAPLPASSQKKNSPQPGWVIAVDLCLFQPQAQSFGQNHMCVAGWVKAVARRELPQRWRQERRKSRVEWDKRHTTSPSCRNSLGRRKLDAN